MQHVPFGRTGLMISRLGMGTMSFGGEADPATSQALFTRCRDAGINFFDCADVYAKGKSEQILGRLIKGCRDELVISTKAYFPTGSDINARGSSRYHLTRAVEASLRRLDTDRIDLFFLHRFDDSTPLEESLRALEVLVQQGKILYLGVSNFAAWQTQKALGISALLGLSRVACVQPMYNLVKRQAEVEILPMALSEGLAVVPYSPLGGGLLTGKYGEDKRPESGRLVDNPMYQLRYSKSSDYTTAELFTALAEARGLHPVSLAVAWAGAHPAVTAPLIGARNLEQLEPALAAAELISKLEEDRELYEEIAELSTAPPPATDRNEEGSAHSYSAMVRK
jgi:aryl-alcohol dehydrogenase-like predicted oxidoreductase